MSVNTVTLVGATGQLGSALAGALAAAADAGKIRLVVTHRAGSDVAKLPAAGERRVLDLDGPTEAVAAALEGSDVVVSALSDKHAALVRALPHVASLKAYVHSDFGGPWTAADIAAPTLGIADKYAARDEAVRLGLPVVQVKSGLFEHYTLGVPIVGVDVKGNKLSLYKDALNQPFPISSLPYLGAGLAHLVSQPPASWAPGHYRLVERFATGAELAAALEAAHGSAPAIDAVDAAELEAKLKAPGAIVPIHVKKWGDAAFARAYDEVGAKPVDVPEYEVLPLNEVVKKYL
ncbi:hypothetical protein Q5752_001025 [Cryptotrichosporon argae]